MIQKTQQVTFAAYKQWCDDTTVEKQRAIEEANQQIEKLNADIQKFNADAARLTREVAEHVDGRSQAWAMQTGTKHGWLRCTALVGGSATPTFTSASIACIRTSLSPPL